LKLPYPQRQKVHTTYGAITAYISLFLTDSIMEIETVTPALNFEQRQCLLQIWVEITYALVLNGQVIELSKKLDSARRDLDVHQAILHCAQNRLAQLFTNVPVPAIEELTLIRLTTEISKARTVTRPNTSQNIDPGGFGSENLDNEGDSATLCDIEMKGCDTGPPTRSARRKRSTKRPPFPLSNKRDLTQADIRPITSFLIDNNALSLDRKSIHHAWTSSSSATFDTVHSLRQNRKRNRLQLRFAYIHLIRQIHAVEEAITISLVSPECRGDRAFDTSRAATKVSISAYFDKKRNNSEAKLSRSQLSEHIRIGKRVLWLAGPTPFQLSLYSKSIETIM
jgi:hypothetical protein